MHKVHILQTIRLIRDSFEGSEIVFKEGSCVKLCLLLKHIYPKGEILYDMDHAIFEYNGRWYDITGEVNKKDHIPLREYGHNIVKKAVMLKFTR